MYTEVLENVNPDLSDSEFDNEQIFDPATPDAGGEGSDRGGGGTPDAEALVLDEDEEEGDGEGDGLFDDDLAAELGRAMAEDSSDEDDEEDDEDESASEEDEDEDEETAQARKLLNEEIRDLEAAVEKKNAEIAGAFNPLIKVCSAL